MIEAAAATTRCLTWLDQFRSAGDVELPMMVPMLKIGKSSPATHPKPL